jgi:VanZ family protein
MRRFWWTLGFLFVGVAVLICLIPGHDIPGALEMNDKASHLMGHGLLALYFTGLLPRQRWWKIFLLLLVMGVVIELAQYHMHVGRQGDARDVLANSAGALLGLFVGWLGVSRWPDWAERLLGRSRAAESK